MANLLSKLTDTQKTKLGLVSGLISMLGLGIVYATTVEKPIDESYKPVTDYGGDFTLQGSDGEVALSDYRNKVVVIYFGFLNCTEACPVSLGTIVGAIHKLTPEERNQLQVLFISIDPERDDIKSITEFTNHYAKHFKKESNPHILKGVTGTRAQIDKVSKDYGVYFDMKDLEGSALAYTVDHSSRFYMVGKDGKLVTTMSHSTTPIELAARIKELQQTTSYHPNNSN